MALHESPQNGLHTTNMGTHNHHNCPGRQASQRALIQAIVIITLFAIIEAITGWWAQSLALLSDAGHMASDAAALSIAAFATWIAQRPPSQQHTYGFGRAEIIAAWISSVMMLLISIFIVIEALVRIESPLAVNSTPMIVIGALGMAVNLIVAWRLIQGQRTLNMRAALLHVISDLLGSIAALSAGLIIHWTHWVMIDPLLSIFISALILLSSIRLLRESIAILMEGVPPHIQLNEVTERLCAIDGVDSIHDLHIWTLTSGMLILTAHIRTEQFSAWPTLLTTLKDTLKEHYQISHVTLQPEVSQTNCTPCHPPSTVRKHHD